MITPMGFHMLFYIFLQALQRTLEFEEELAEKFGSTSRSKEAGSAEDIDRVGQNSQIVSDIRKKYEKKLAAHHGSENEVCIIISFWLNGR